LREALVNQRSELAMRSTIAAAYSADAPAMHLLALAHGFLGELLKTTGDASEYAEWREAVRIADMLVRRDPTNAAWRQTLAFSQRALAADETDRGNLAAATTLLNSARSALEEIVAKDSAATTARARLALTQVGIARVARLRGRLVDAQNECRTALALAAQLSGKGEGPRVEAEAWLESGRAYAAAGSPREANNAWQHAERATATAAKPGGPTVEQITRAWALSYLKRSAETRAAVDTLLRRGVSGERLPGQAKTIAP
jgi:hypothetical protein